MQEMKGPERFRVDPSDPNYSKLSQEKGLESRLDAYNRLKAAEDPAVIRQALTEIYGEEPTRSMDGTRIPDEELPQMRDTMLASLEKELRRAGKLE